MDNPVSQQPRLDMYAQDLLRQSYQTNPISSDVLNQYGQGMDQQVVQPPAIENYAPQQQYSQQQMPQQQFAQEAAPQRTLQPDRDRMAYYKLVQDRFNEIVNYAGGIENVAKAKNIELAQRKAAEDVAAYYGAPPAIEQPMSEKERIELEQAKLQERKARFDLQQAQKQAKNPEKKPSDLVTQIGKETSTYLVKQKPMIGQLENAIKLAESPNVPINEKLASMKLIGKLMNSVMVGTSDAVSQDEAGILLAEVNEKIKPSGLWTSEAVFGNDLPQFVSKLKNLRDSVTNEYNNSIDLVSEIDPEISKIFKKKTLYSQPQAEGMPQAQPTANEPMRMTSPGAISFVRDDSTGKLIRQQ